MHRLEIRGLHLDPARRPLSISTVLRIIDRAAQCHINALHLHLTDDQGIAFESKVLDFHDGWSFAEQDQIYAKCAEHGIEIIPEIDIPGHTTALRSILHDGKHKPEKKMGMISNGLIELTDLPAILRLYTEVANRFHVKYFHMGGDETRGTKREFFQELVDCVCEWGKKKHIQIIAWEDILAKVEPPDNLIVQKWKHRSYPPIAKALEAIGNGRVIYSVNYYLDTCIDPFTAYRTKIPEGTLGCVACTWGELIGDENVESTVFPALYLLGHRWYNLGRNDNATHVLFNERKRIGWIKEGRQRGWKRRQWRGFVLKADEVVPERSTTSISTEVPMTRKEDQYPLISNFLISMARDFYRIMDGKRSPLKKNIKRYAAAMLKANGDEKIVGRLLEVDATTSVKDFKTLLRRIRSTLEAEEQDLYKNGIRMVIRECLRF